MDSLEVDKRGELTSLAKSFEYDARDLECTYTEIGAG